MNVKKILHVLNKRNVFCNFIFNTVCTTLLTKTPPQAWGLPIYAELLMYKKFSLWALNYDREKIKKIKNIMKVRKLP